MYYFLLCLFTHSLFVRCLWSVLVYIALKRVSGCTVYKCTKWDLRSMTWVCISSFSVNKVKVIKGAVTCLICLQMEKCNWIRVNTYWWSHQYTSSSIGQNNKVTTYVLQGFSLWLGSKSFKKSVCMRWSKSVCVKNGYEQNDNLIFFQMQNLFLHSAFIRF